MFTGIVEEIGMVARLRRSGEDAVLAVQAQTVLEGTKLGDSIAVNGVCLTVTELRQDGFTVDLSAETLRRTNLGAVQSGEQLNLERSLRYGGQMGGHFVQGHVDDTGTVVSVMPEGRGRIVRFRAGPDLMRFIVPKGYIAVDGMSLTAIEPDADSFAVALIPHTLAHSVAQHYRPGVKVNLEADVLGKYVEKLLASREQHATGVTRSLLAETGFIS